jgi:hypothetical protein
MPWASHFLPDRFCRGFSRLPWERLLSYPGSRPVFWISGQKKDPVPHLLLGQDLYNPAVPPGLTRPARPLNAYHHTQALVHGAPPPSRILRDGPVSARPQKSIRSGVLRRHLSAGGSLEKSKRDLLTLLQRFKAIVIQFFPLVKRLFQSFYSAVFPACAAWAGRSRRRHRPKK